MIYLLKFVAIFYKLSFKLSPEILRQLYFAFIYPYISYGIGIYANACYSRLNKLIVQNNKILRIIQRQKMTTPVRNLYSNNCLSIPLLHDYQLLLIAHKCMFHQNLLPEVFHDYFVCNTLVDWFIVIVPVLLTIYICIVFVQVLVLDV